MRNQLPGLLLLAAGVACSRGQAQPPAALGDPTQAVAQPRTASLHFAGSGSGSIVVDQAALTCTAACQIAATGLLPLRAVAAAGSIFVEWSGACSGQLCSLSLDEDRDVTARFDRALPPGSLTVAPPSPGRIVSDPPGIDCPGTCQLTAPEGTSVRLTAQPAAGWQFNGWAGDCPPTGAPCTVRFSNGLELRVSAAFTQLFGQIDLIPEGGGQIRMDLPPHQRVPLGTVVNLVAEPSPGYRFTGWGGPCSGYSPSCSLTIDLPYSYDVIAWFEKIPAAVQIAVLLAGPGGGRVTSDPPGLDCPGRCLLSVPGGAHVTLTGLPDGGSQFSSWRGACTGAGSCAFDALADTSVWASFDGQQPAPACAGVDALPASGSKRGGVAAGSYAAYCLAGTGDAQGTLALPRALNDSSAHGADFHFVTTGGGTLSSQYSNTWPYPVQQPEGVLVWGGCGQMCPWSALRISAFDHAGAPLGELLLGANAPLVAAGDPGGGLLLAGAFSSTPDSKAYSREAIMFAASASGPVIRWGPVPLPGGGALIAGSVDVLGRTLLAFDGSSSFGTGSLSARWFDVDGKPLTEEFLLTDGATGETGSLELAQLIGGGLLLVGRGHDPQALVTVASGAAKAEAAPAWMQSLPDTRLQIVQGGRGYAVIPMKANRVACSQSVGVVSPAGDWCSTSDFPLAQGQCDTFDLTMGADGTVIQQLPSPLEHWSPTYMSHSCTWQWWPAAR